MDKPGSGRDPRPTFCARTSMATGTRKSSSRAMPIRGSSRWKRSASSILTAASSSAPATRAAFAGTPSTRPGAIRCRCTTPPTTAQPISRSRTTSHFRYHVLWTIPNAQSESCKVKAVAYGPGRQFDESDACFSMARLAVGEQRSPMIWATRLIGIQPNPIASNAEVRFQLKDECRLTLRACDVTGRTVALLANGVMKPGVYHRDWEVAPAVPNGIYFIRLETRTAGRRRR